MAYQLVFLTCYIWHLNTVTNKNLSVNSCLAPFKTASNVPMKAEPGA